MNRCDFLTNPEPTLEEWAENRKNEKISLCKKE